MVEIGGIPMYDLKCCKCNEDWRIMLPKENMPFVCWECVVARYENKQAAEHKAWLNSLLPLQRKTEVVKEWVRHKISRLGDIVGGILVVAAYACWIIADCLGFLFGLVRCWWEDRNFNKEEVDNGRPSS
jgi:hypothetical protein